MWRQNLILTSMLMIVSCKSENPKRHEDISRSGKLFTFNTIDEDVKIELQFSVPFLSVPVKRTMDSVYGLWSHDMPSININPASLALGGAIVLTTTVVVPFILKVFSEHYPQDRYSRLLDNAHFSTEPLLNLASKMLVDSEAVRACTLRVACWTAQKTDPEHVKIWHELKRNTLLSTMINATAMDDAIYSGRNGRDCTFYTPCPLKEEHIPILLGNLAIFTNTIGKRK